MDKRVMKPKKTKKAFAPRLRRKNAPTSLNNAPMSRETISIGDELRSWAAAFFEGQLDQRLDPDRFAAKDREAIESVNQAAAEHASMVNEVSRVLAQYGAGEFSGRVLGTFKVDLGAFKESTNTVGSNVNFLKGEIEKLGRAVSSGNLAHRCDSSALQGDWAVILQGINRPNEIGQSAVRQMAESIMPLATSSEELTAVSEQMKQNSEETAMQASVVSASAGQVSRSVQTVAAAAEELNASFRKVALNAIEAAKVATSAVEIARDTNDTIAKLGNSSNEIGKIIKVITSIAQQTNLLALNATIESARAGAAGKSFAVVANEVKELAKETSKATDDISRKIEVIQTDTERAVRAIGQITEVIGRINQIQILIAGAVEEQTVTAREIGHNISEAATGSSEIAQNIARVADVARSTTGAAENTRRAAVELERMATGLHQLMDRFKF